MTTTLEQVHEDLIVLKKEIRELKDCFHEDLLELSDKTKKDIEESRKELKAGKGISLEEVERKLARR